MPRLKTMDWPAMTRQRAMRQMILLKSSVSTMTPGPEAEVFRSIFCEQQVPIII